MSETSSKKDDVVFFLRQPGKNSKAPSDVGTAGSQSSITMTNPPPPAKRARREMSSGPTVLSLDEVQVHVVQEVYDYLAESLVGLHDGNKVEARNHLDRIFQAMKTAPATTTCRVNQILSSRKEVQEGLEQVMESWKNRHGNKTQNGAADAIVVEPHLILPDVVCVGPLNKNTPSQSLSSCRVPPTKTSNGSPSSIFKSWPERQERGWPMTHRVVICDRFCGEAVLRGSDIFVRGVLCADAGIEANETVAVYADVREASQRPVSRGLLLINYTGQCIFLGLGVARRSRTEMFTNNKGVAVEMSCCPEQRAGPALPPLSGIMSGKFMMQNLPSILVAHVLDPQPGDVIIDLCSAPGGKTSHVASLVKNNATIVACDKSRRKMVSAHKLFEELGATCITPLAWDSTCCVVRDGSERKSVEEILSSAQVSPKDGLKNIKAFYPESFDRILLDPPCSALGLRPKLLVDATTLEDLEKHVKYQRQFVKEAVSLLKPGGSMTYSTCTFHAAENEGMVRHILDTYSEMRLVDAGRDIGQAGLSGVGLRSDECRLVRRFDPSNEVEDTMGFFVAKFVKRRV